MRPGSIAPPHAARWGLSQAALERRPPRARRRDAPLRVRTANRSAYRTFRASPAQTQDRFVYDLGDGQWGIPELLTLRESVLARNVPVHDFGVSHEFAELGRRTMLLNARRRRPR